MDVNLVEFVIYSSDESNLEPFPGISGAMCCQILSAFIMYENEDL